MGDKFTAKVHHMIATYLTPGLKNKFISQYYDQKLVSDASKELQDLLKTIPQVIVIEQEAPPAKKSKQDDMLSKFYSKSFVNPRTSLTEIEKYRAMVVTDEYKDDNPLSFWKRTEHLFPRLSKLATRLICIPATSVKSEQNFSSAGLFMRDRRTNMKSNT